MKVDYLKNNIKYFEDIILYKGIFYHKTPENFTIHNRFNINIQIKNIKLLNKENVNCAIQYTKPIIFIEGFNHNIGHLIWDCMYPSWYCLFFKNENLWNNDFVWMVKHKMYIEHDGKQRNKWHLDILKKFSGNDITTNKLLLNKFNKPIKINLLISGLINLGLGCRMRNLCINKQFKHHNNDPVNIFINRFFLRYNITRNIHNINNISDIIFIHNKRKYNGINELFEKLNDEYKNLYNFKYIDLSKHTFEEELNIYNKARMVICGVGTARANSCFMPIGSVEIQTNRHNKTLPNNIGFFDTHLGTISDNLKVININEYTEHECDNNLCSNKLECLIKETLKIIPYTKKINVENNLPTYINKHKINLNDNQFKSWQKSCSNNITDIYKYILNKS